MTEPITRKQLLDTFPDGLIPILWVDDYLATNLKDQAEKLIDEIPEKVYNYEDFQMGSVVSAINPKIQLRDKWLGNQSS